MDQLFADIALGVTVVTAWLSGFEKMIAVGERRARWHPVVLAWPLLVRRSSLTMAASGVVDVTLGVAMLASLGSLFMVVIWMIAVATYTVLGYRAVSLSGSCGCLAGALEVGSRVALLGRNAALVGLASVAAFATPVDRWRSVLLGAGLLTLAGIVATRYKKSRVRGSFHSRPRARPARDRRIA